MMADFQKAFALTMGNEGGYADNPNDRGGETYKGIARNFWGSWPGWKIIDSIKAQTQARGQALAAFINKTAASNSVLQTLVQSFYKANFWDANNLDYLNSQLIANEMFDTGVNQGTGVAARYLQQALNLCNKNQISYPDIAEDGAIGKAGETMKTVNEKASEVAVLNTINMLQGERYLEIMRANKSQEQFWQSWLSRIIVTGKWR